MSLWFQIRPEDIRGGDTIQIDKSGPIRVHHVDSCYSPGLGPPYGVWGHSTIPNIETGVVDTSARWTETPHGCFVLRLDNGLPVDDWSLTGQGSLW